MIEIKPTVRSFPIYNPMDNTWLITNNNEPYDISEMDNVPTKIVSDEVYRENYMLPESEVRKLKYIIE